VNVDLMEKISLKVCYINDMLEDISEIQDALLIDRLNLFVNKEKFWISATKLSIRNIDTLHFEMNKFEDAFRRVNSELQVEYQRRQKLQFLIKQESALIALFPLLLEDLNELLNNKAFDIKVPSVIAEFPAMILKLKNLNEISTYFKRISEDYQKVVNMQDVNEFINIKTNININSLTNVFLKITPRSAANKNKMLKLDKLRNDLERLNKEIPEKIKQISEANQEYVKKEMAESRSLLHSELSASFEKVEPKLFAVQELLKKGLRGKEERASEALKLRQTILRYETIIWAEYSTQLFEEMNAFVNGTNTWRLDDFDIALQRFVKEKNEAIKAAKNEFSPLLEKNRDYKNELERLIHTKSSYSDFEILCKKMGGFRFFKMVFYKFK